MAHNSGVKEPLKEKTTHVPRVLSWTFDSLRPHGLYTTRLLYPWDSPGNNTGVGCYVLLQGIFPTQGSNPHFMSPALAGGFFTTNATWDKQTFISFFLITSWQVVRSFPNPHQSLLDVWVEGDASEFTTSGWLMKPRCAAWAPFLKSRWKGVWE